MNWEAVGAVGELLGAGAVVATIAYLAIQVRQSKSMLQTNQNLAIGQAYQHRTSITSDNFRAQLANHDPISIRVKMARGEELTEEEKGTMQIVAALGHFAYDNMHYQYFLGLLDEETWSGTRAVLKESLRDELFARSVDLPKPMYSI